jgi:integrase
VLPQSVLLHTMRNILDLDNRLISRAIDELGAALPADWRTEVEFESAGTDRAFDALVRLCVSDGTSGTNLLGRHFKPLLKRAELPPVRSHDLHHSCATMLLVAENVSRMRP